MKKNLLLAAILFLSMSGNTFCAPTSSPPQSEVHQKACQNVFSLINIDMSFMSPRATMTDSRLDMAAPPMPPKRDPIVPIANKQAMKQSCPPPLPLSGSKEIQRNRTSLFRIDLLHFIKLQIL